MATRKSKINTVEVTEAVLYLRVSTEDQAESGLGLEDQETRCRAWAIARGYSVVAVHTDAGVSASTLNRPALERALADLCPGRILVSLKLDRMTRTVAHFPDLVSRIEGVGAKWAVVTEGVDTSTAQGELMLNLLLVFSQFERKLIGERTSAALQAKRVRGEFLGSVMYGYTLVDGALVANPGEQAVITFARSMRDQGHSLRVVAMALTREGFTTKRNGSWTAATVARITDPARTDTHAATA